MQQSLYSKQPALIEGMVAMDDPKAPRQSIAVRVVDNSGVPASAEVARVCTSYGGEMERAEVGGAGQVLGISFDVNRHHAGLYTAPYTSTIPAGQTVHLLQKGILAVSVGGGTPTAASTYEYNASGELILGGGGGTAIDARVLRFVEHDADSGLTKLEVRV